MNPTKNGSTVYVYTLAEDGRVIERPGIVSHKQRGKKLMLVTFNGGQRICLSSAPGEIRNNNMWSAVPMKNVYIEKMIEILMDRREDYQRKLEATTRRITKVRTCYE